MRWHHTTNHKILSFPVFIFKRVVRLLILLVAVLSLTGCQATLTQEKVVHVTLWQGVNPPPNRDVLLHLVDKFNQTHADIQVDSLYVGQPDQQMPKILAAVVGNAAPDLLWYSLTIAGQLVELNALLPLDEMLKTSAVMKEIDPALFATTELQSKM